MRSLLASSLLVAFAWELGCGVRSADPPATDALPCDVDEVLTKTCRVCHGEPPAHGAPMPLVTFADTRAPYTQLPQYDGTPTWKVMGDAVDTQWMPQPWPGVQMTDAQRAVIVTWAKNGAPAAPPGMRCTP